MVNSPPGGGASSRLLRLWGGFLMGRGPGALTGPMSYLSYCSGKRERTSLFRIKQASFQTPLG